jgi:hypothetical protein
MGECGDCGGQRCRYVRYPDTHSTEYDCPDCGEEGADYDEDLYGAMSVPWGFLL